MRKSPPPRLQSTGEKEEMLKNKFTQKRTFSHYLLTPQIFTVDAKLKALVRAQSEGGAGAHLRIKGINNLFWNQFGITGLLETVDFGEFDF